MTASKKLKNRWLIAASAIGIHISIGSIYAYSAWLMPLENTFGWSASDTALAFSLAIFFMGIAAAFLGRFVARLGAAKGSGLSALLFCGGLMGAGLACWLESLYLFYLFFGVISGVGLGVGYVAPVATLVKWFPDRRGLATGMAIMGFGFGGLVCTQLIDRFAPAQGEIVLPVEEEVLPYVRGERQPDTATLPSLEAYKAEAAKVSELKRAEQTGSAEYQAALAVRDEYKAVILYDKQAIVMTFVWLALIYLGIMLPSAFYLAPPPADYAERTGLQAKKAGAKAEPSHVVDVPVSKALRTPAFYGLWFILFLNVTCGITLVGTAKKMGYEMVGLNIAMASFLVMGISLFNGLGRLFWASLSDYIGRPTTYIALFAIQLVAFPLLANSSQFPWVFMGLTFLILTCYGAGFACMPAFISDLFGLEDMPTILGFILTAKSVAGIVGPMANAYIYESTGSYTYSLYLFGALFILGLGVAGFMKRQAARLQAA